MVLSLLRAIPMLPVIALYLGVSACSRPAPTTPEECAALGSAADRDECYLALVPAVFKRDPAAGITMVETGISDALTKDMAWYNVTKLVDPHSNKYCDRMVDPAFAKRCRDVVSRPHLHRELTGQEGARPGGPPPPGGAAPPSTP